MLEPSLPSTLLSLCNELPLAAAAPLGGPATP